MYNNVKRVVSVAAAAACLFSAVKLVPFSFEDVSAAEIMTPFEITKDIKIGWNLGNSLDSTTSISDPSPADTETAWGNPVTTKAMIDTVKAKGFNAIRVPTTWYQHLDSNNNIDTDYLDRVQEVVDYAYKQGMYVILNVHHEAWVNRPDLGTAYDEMSVKLTAIWKQIAERFADYDQHLIFEGMNEPRAAETDHEWYGPLQSEYDTINKLDQDFVDTVRSVDSPYQDTRLLMVPPYCATSDSSMYSNLIVPDDDYICVSLHAYSPYSFVMDKTADHTQFTAANANELKNILTAMRDNYLDKDIPVIIGEFSSSNYQNTEARCEWAEYYLTTAKEFGLPCFLWDNNVDVNPGDPSEAHGYLDRANLSWYSASEPVIDTMMDVLNDSSVVWGSKRKAPIYVHPDINSGKNLYKFAAGQTIDSSVKDGNCTPSYDVSWSVLENKDVAVKFTGTIPNLAFMDDNWDNWTEFKPYQVDKENGIAYYSYESIKAGWTFATEPTHLLFRTDGVTTITQIQLIDLPQVFDPNQGGPQPTTGEVKRPDDDPDFKFSTKTYQFAMPERAQTDKTTVTLEIGEGIAKANVGGCIGYSVGDVWNDDIQWKTDLDEDGKATVVVDVTDIPVDVKTAQIQIWWCNVDKKDKDCDLVDYKITVDGQSSTTEPTTSGGGYEFELKKYPIDGFSADTKTVTFTVTGEPKASVGGGVGYVPGDGSSEWENINWSVDLGADGTAKVTVEMPELPAGSKGGEIQVWWSNIDTVDYDYDVTDIKANGGSTVEPTTGGNLPEVTKYGDADLDGEVGISDAVTIMSYVANKVKYPLSDQALANADVNNRGDGISNMDALAVQKYLAQIINSLPETA